MSPSVYKVSEFTREVRALLEGRFSEIWITGEVSNLATPASGHIYFSLKDDRAQIRCAMFRSRRLKYSGDLDDGAAVLVRGKVSIYEPRGDFQLIVDYIEPAGEGELRRKFELLKARLDNEGLFDPAQRRALPALPRRVGLITSSQGAAVRDVLSTLARRFPLADVDLHPVMVQGETAAPQIAQALAKMGNLGNVDVVILARGGGSLEDLWAFNEEVVVRAIRNSPAPVVTGIGHETDFTLADFAADLRCATPTAAAEAITPDPDALDELLLRHAERLQSTIGYRLQLMAQQVDGAQKGLPHPRDRLAHRARRLLFIAEQINKAWHNCARITGHNIERYRQRLQTASPMSRLPYLRRSHNEYKKQVTGRMTYLLERQVHALDTLESRLRALSPLATLERGFAVVQLEENSAVVRSSDQLTRGAIIHTRFARGSARAHVDTVVPAAPTNPSHRSSRSK